jgi:hypothetical protein
MLVKVMVLLVLIVRELVFITFLLKVAPARTTVVVLVAHQLPHHQL